ncbi:MAG: hypothetical protein ACU0FT_08075 [Paracoccus sp. (in: a-proteobacteria)]|uniref:hypothetical protein n=1 Tax=Paracoccus sp. TaxID=267 RepID=UPI004057DEA2
MNGQIKLSPADHVLIHACGALLTDSLMAEDRAADDAMVAGILRDVLGDVNGTHPSLEPFLIIGTKLAHAGPREIQNLRATEVGIIRQFHRRRMAQAWDLIIDRYRQEARS